MTDRPPSTSPEAAARTASSITFPAFVLSLAHTAAVHFGDVPDPAMGKPGALNLTGAQRMIDILALLEAKTRGNLSAEERQLLEQVLYELRLRYLDATKAVQERPTDSRVILP
jgi:hypothetical protein